jgi:purine-binding chemotaxis protein CheW
VSDDELHVVFRVADAEYALPARDVLQMESFQGATVVPGTAAWVAGLVQVRGRVVPVIDLRARFGLPPIERTLDTRIIVVQRRGRTVGLLVDLSRHVLRLAAASVQPRPDPLADASGGFVRAVARADHGLLMLIDLDTVLGEELPHGDA